MEMEMHMEIRRQYVFDLNENMHVLFMHQGETIPSFHFYSRTVNINSCGLADEIASWWLCCADACIREFKDYEHLLVQNASPRWRQKRGCDALCVVWAFHSFEFFWFCWQKSTYSSSKTHNPLPRLPKDLHKYTCLISVACEIASVTVYRQVDLIALLSHHEWTRDK